MLATEAPDAGHGGTGCSACASGVLSVPGLVTLRHRTPGTGRGLNRVGVFGAASLM